MLAADGVKNLDKGSWSDGKSIALSPETGKEADGEKENPHPMSIARIGSRLYVCIPKAVGEP